MIKKKYKFKVNWNNLPKEVEVEDDCLNDAIEKAQDKVMRQFDPWNPMFNLERKQRNR